MKSFTGKTLRWEWRERVVELTLDHEPANEIGTAMVAELEKFVASFGALVPETSVCIITSARKSIFSAGDGQDLRIARSTASQITKFDGVTQAAAKKFIKPMPDEELRREIDLFCELFTRPDVMAALKKFLEDSGPMPYLP